MSTSRGTIGIVIPTHNRYDKLRALLRSVRRYGTAQIKRVVVVDDSDEPNDLVPEFKDLNLTQIIASERIFISKAKNFGWRNTDTEYVYFIDDDNIIGEQTIRPVFEVISTSDSTGAIMPAVMYKSRPEFVWVYATPFLNSRLVLNLVGRNQVRNASLENRLLKTDALPNASLVRRKALEDVGGFDERLVVNSSMDFAMRLKAKSWRVFSYTGALIYHDVEPPGHLGWWATHGSVDPDRVRYELRDWFMIMRIWHTKKRLFRLSTTAESFRFVLPNLLAYLARSKSRRRLVRSLMTGYLEGLRIIN